MKLSYFLINQKLHVALLIIFVVTLPFPMIINNPIIVCLAANWLLGFDFKTKLSRLKENILFFLFASIFILQPIGLLWTDDIPDGLFSIEKTLSLFLFPLVLATSQKLSNSQVRLILKAFVASCIVATGYCIAVAIHKNYQLCQFQWIHWNHYTIEMSYPLGMSHVYLGLFLSFAFFIVSYLFITKENKKVWDYIFLALLLSYLVAFVVIITSKIAFVSLLILSLVCSLILFKRKLIVFSVIFLAFAIIVTVMQKHIPLITKRAIEVFDISSEPNSAHSFYYSQRMATIDCSWKLIKENWVIGVGTGDSFHLLNNCYEQKGIPEFKGLDTHNQYFDFLLTFGIGGLLLFFACLFIPLYLAIKEKQFLYIIFLCHFMICGLTENLLDNNKGIVFYAFFNSLLAFNTLKRVNEKV